MGLKIAVAQISSVRGDVEENLERHIQASVKAGELGVDYLVFPELSLTGYEPELAAELAFTSDDLRLKPLIEIAGKHQMSLAVGAPISGATRPLIGTILVNPSGTIDIYSKMHMHSGEDQYFMAGSEHLIVSIKNTLVANAICADTSHPDHAKLCAEKGANVYAAGVLISEAGYPSDSALLQQYSKIHNMLVVMANHSGPTGNWKPIGKSAMWWRGELLAIATESDSSLVIAECQDGAWKALVSII
ncbi:carbon-nitrogen hydrolase family protein [Hahella ganghwensis]|uniref:carbon-nitrogen hydrolase family protein n=1 Tax=Hahella ganghwensis TaxID=286420 RepID=UPI00037C5EA1|nr:carbon-nitrogen hydrolase family protein [Hahella ganghwensis]